MRILNSCDTEIAKAINKLLTDIAEPHQGTNSTRYTTTAVNHFSIWRKIKEHLDEPIAAFLEKNEQYLDRRLLPEKMSEIGKKPPEFWVDERAQETFVRSEVTRLSVVQYKSTDPSQFRLRVTQVEANIQQWFDNIQNAIRIAKVEQRRLDDDPSLLSTLEALLEIIWFIKSDRCRPQSNQTFYTKEKKRNTKDSNEISKKSLPDKRTRYRSPQYCELCWRLTQWSKVLDQKNAPYTDSDFKKNDRFCDFHAPNRVHSQYRNDLRYKQAFNNEIESLINKSKSLYAIGYAIPCKEMDHLRKSAYDLVHSQMIKTSNSADNKKTLIEKVFQLREKNWTQSQISRELGITRQSVWSAFKKIDRLIEISGNEKYLSVITGETATTSSGVISKEILTKIEQWINEDPEIDYLKIRSKLRATGTSISTITKNCNYFKHTVSTAVRLHIQKIKKENLLHKQ
ncbi:transcriptional regulator with XRE-family HTH domain [Oxalobacteraceae bacterium GrIS 2.11]